MNKRIAVVIKDRQDEAIRMSIGLTLMDDNVDVFLLDKELIKTKDNELNIETLGEMDIKTYSNIKGSEETTYIPTATMARELLSYDHILPY